MLLNEEIKNKDSSQLKAGVNDFLVNFLETSKNPLVVYCFDNCKTCDAIIGDYLARHHECTIKTTQDIVENLPKKIKNSIILDVGIIPFHLLIFDSELGYFIVYRNKIMGAYFEESDELKPLVISVAEKVERINKMKL